MNSPRIELERAEPSIVRAMQMQRLKALLAKTLAQNEFYRRHWGAAGASVDRMRSLDDFASIIPTVEKKHFVADQEAHPPFGRRLMPAQASGKQLQFFMTSGTSGQGQELHAQTSDEADGTAEVYAHMFRWSGVQPRQHMLMTLAMTMMAGGRCELLGAERFGLTVYCAGNYDAKKKLEFLDRFKPTGIIGTTSYFGHLSAVSGQRPPAPSVKYLFGGGEGAGVAWYQRLQEEWQARFFDRYGSTQSRNDHMFSCEQGIGTSSRPGMLHNVDSHVLFEIVDPATGRHVADGEQGEVVLTSLYHTDTPLIRCRMRDTAVYREGRYCACGRCYRGLELGSIGRSDDMHRVKGVNIWPQAVDDLMFSIPEIDEYFVTLSTNETGADIGTIQVMPKDPAGVPNPADFASHVREKLRERVGVRFEIALVPLGTLQRSEYKARRWRDERAYKTGRPS
jgi:phenylacetate-CoA ligase